MSQSNLQAIARPKQSGSFKEINFIQGNMFGKNIQPTSVKFDREILKQVIQTNGQQAKVAVEFNNKVMNGFIKEIQVAIMSQEITHVDIQITD